MSVRTDVINLSINVRGNQAQNELNNLRKKAADLRFEMQGLKKGSEEYASKAKELQTVTSEIDRLKKEIGLTSLTQKELNQELTRLKALRSSVVPFTQEFRDLDEQIKRVEARLYDVRNGVQGFASFWSKVNDQVKQFGMLAAGYLGFQFLTSQITNIVSGSGKLSDQLADIAAKTQMTQEETKGLNSELGKIDTRTTTSALRDIATVGGQLGVAKKDVEGFTQSMDELNVTLGDEFDNNVEELTNRTAKIRNTFAELRSDHIDEDLLHIGNALQVLAQDGVATAPVVTDFAQRIGSAGTVYGMTAGQVFGLSAAYQEMGITSERGSTATVKLLQKMAAAPDMFLKVVQTADPAIATVQQFTDIINGKEVQGSNGKLYKGITDALLLVSKGFAASKGNATAFAEQLADAEIGSAAIAEVLSKLGQNTDMVSTKIKTAGDALQSTSSITEQFAIKNNTFGATLDKLGKEFNALATSGAVTSFLQGAVESTLSFIRFLKDLPNWLRENRTTLIALTTVILAYVAAKSKATQASLLNKIATLLEVAADKLEAAQKFILTAATSAYATAKDFLTGRIKIATVAQRIWNTVIKENPLVAIIALIGALATGISYLVSKMRELTIAQKLANEVQRMAGEATAEELSKINMLKSVLDSQNASYDNKKKALQSLIALNPSYLSGLTLENIKTKEGKDILDGYIASLQQKAEMEAKQALLTDKLKARNQIFADFRSVPELSKKSDEQIVGLVNAGFSTVEGKNKNDAAGIEKLIEKDGFFGNGYDFDKAKETLDQVKILQDDLTKAAIKNVEAVTGATGNIVQQSTTRTIQSIKDQIKVLEDAYVQIDVKNKSALKDNAGQRKKLQDELDGLEGKKSPDDKKALRDLEKTKTEAEQFKAEIEKLRHDLEVNGQNMDDAEVARIQQKYDELVKRAKKYAFDVLQIEGLRKEELSQLYEKRFNKLLAESNEKEYAQSLSDVKDYYEEQRTITAQSYADGYLNKKQYSDKIKSLDLEEKEAVLETAENYKETTKKAADDVLTLRRQKEQEATKQLVEETDKRIELLEKEKLAKANRAVLTARPGTDGEFDAKKKLLQAQFDLDVEYLDKKSELYKEREANLNKDLISLQNDYNQKRIEKVGEYVGYAVQAMEGVSQIITNLANRDLQKEEKANDAKKTSLKKQLDSKAISQTTYDKKIKALEEESDRRRTEVQRKQAAREKAISLFGAIANTAQAVTAALTMKPWTPANFVLAAIAGALGAVQVGVIASQPLPQLGTGGMLEEGPYHSEKEKGLHVVNPRTGKTEMLLEKDEAVVNGNAMRSNEKITATGTPSQIASAINSRYGGVSWNVGASINAPKWVTATPPQINPNMPRVMAVGGMVNGSSYSSDSADGNSQVSVLLRELISEQKNNTEEIKTMKTKLHAVVSIKEYEDQKSKYDAAKQASGV